LWFQNFGIFFLFLKGFFLKFTQEKRISDFFPQKFLATLRKFAPKNNYWPKPLFSGLGYHSDNGTINAISDQVPWKKSKLGPIWKWGPILPRT
jgi:hypothetical protein